MNARQMIDSPLLGPSAFPPTEEEIATTRKLLADVPVLVFQELNKTLNRRGMMISIDTLPDDA